jgi:hypothetical protein
MKRLWLLVILILIVGVIQAQRVEIRHIAGTPHVIQNDSDIAERSSENRHATRVKKGTDDIRVAQGIEIEHITKLNVQDDILSAPRTTTPIQQVDHTLHPIVKEDIHRHALPPGYAVLHPEKTPVTDKKAWTRPQENLYVKGEILIQLKNEARSKVNVQIQDGAATFGIPELDAVNERFTATHIDQVVKELLPRAEEFGLDLIFVITVSEDLDLEMVSAEYRLIADVKEVSPNYLPFKHVSKAPPSDAPTRVVPNDPYYDWSDSIVKGPECWGIPQTGSNSITISVLDIERLYQTHQDLDGNYLGFKGGATGTGDHGTMCISVACAELNNSPAQGMAGLAGGWNNNDGVQWTGYVFTSASDNITAITWSVNIGGADVLTESIGFGGNPAGLESAFEWAWSQGVLSCASAGNDAASTEPGWPAYYGVVIAVGGCDALGQLWDWGTGVGSNIGEWVDIIAPGDAQYCCSQSSYANSYGGTSFATPAVAAAAALMLSANSSLTPAQLRERLIRSADYNEHKSPEYAGLMGAGIVDLYEAIEIHDVNVSVNEIIDVPSSPPLCMSIVPKAVVQNRGVGLASFNVVAEARQISVVYADTVQVTNLAPNTETQQNAEICLFKKWIPSSAGAYTFKIYTTLSGDQNRDNDTLSIQVDVQGAGAATYDTLIYEASSPAWYFGDDDFYWAVRCSPAQPCSLASIIFYAYSTTAGNYYIYSWYDNGGVPGSVATGPQTYAWSANGWATVNYTTKPFFTGDFHLGFQCTGGDYGPWVIADAGAGSGRSEFSADGSSWNVFGSYNWCIRAVVMYPPPSPHDMLTQSIVVPDGHELTGMPLIPTAIFRNIGSSSESSVSVTMKIDSLGSQIYTSSKTISGPLGKYDADTILFDGWVPNYEGGTYNVTCYHSLSTDSDRSNDTLYLSVSCNSLDTLVWDDYTSRIGYIDPDAYWAVTFYPSRPCSVIGVDYKLWVGGSPPVCTLFAYEAANDTPTTRRWSRTRTGVDGWNTYNFTALEKFDRPNAEDFALALHTYGLQGNDTLMPLFDDSDESPWHSYINTGTGWGQMARDMMLRARVKYYGGVYSHDVTAKQIVAPGLLVSALYDTPVEAKVANLGAGTETFNTWAQITESGGPQVYSQSVNVSSLSPGGESDVFFPDWQPAKAYQDYDLTVYTALGSDVNRNNDTLIQTNIYSTPNDVIWYDDGGAAYYWGDPDARYTAQRFSPEAGGWLIGCWVAMQSDVNPWPACSIFIWDDDDGWKDGGLPDASVEYLGAALNLAPGDIGAYAFTISLPPIWVDTTSDFFICIWNAEPPEILLDDTTNVWRSFSAEEPDTNWQVMPYDLLLRAIIRYDFGAPPKTPYIYAKKNAAKDSVIVYWPAITQDTLNDPTAIEQYELYSNIDPGYIPAGADFVGATADTFFVEPIPDSTRHYLEYAVSVYLQISDKSNMGYALRKFVNENTGATSDRNWVSLPWHCEYSTVSDLTDDLSPNGDPLIKVTALQDDQVYRSWIWDPDFLEWYGTDFAIVSGRSYEMVTISDDTIIVVGSNNPSGLIPLNENAGATSDRNWVSIPYNAVYGTASDITDEYAATGDPLIKLTSLQDDQIYRSWIWDPDFLEWYGTDFAIEEGRGYEFVTINDTTWNPTEYTNVTFKQMLARRKARKMNIELNVGTLTEPQRMPAWTLSEDGYVLASDKRATLVRDAGISHVVRAHFDIDEYEEIVFTAYRPDKPCDVLTEDMLGCGFARNDEQGAVWFDVGNFFTAWQENEGIVLIVEALSHGRGYFAAVNVTLNTGTDIQELDDLVFVPIPESQAFTSGLNTLDNENIIGYSVYEGDRRLNNQILTSDYATGDVVVRPVFKGGHETVFASHGTPTGMIPRAYTFTIYPNPFSRKTTVDFAIPKHTPVEVKVYDVSGKLVKTLVSETQKPGYYNIFWHGDDNIGRQVASGVYFVQMNAEGFESQQKVIFVH